MNKRQRKIIDTLSSNEKANVKDLADRFAVSAVTIRQDLNYLEEEGFLKRVHGGAILQNADDISKRLVMNYDKKVAIARKAASFINEGETILIESGSTNAILVKELENRTNVNIITTNAFIARELKKSDHANIILLGGSYQQESESLVGQLTRLCLDNVNFSKAFIGVDGYTRETGFTSTNMMRAEISSLIAKRSPEVFVLTDSSKFGKVHLSRLFYPEEITCLITDSGIPDREKANLEGRGVLLYIV